MIISNIRYSLSTMLDILAYSKSNKLMTLKAEIYWLGDY